MDLLTHPLVAILWSLVMLLVGTVVGDLKRSWMVSRKVEDIGRKLTDHSVLEAHPVSVTWHRQHDEEREAMGRRLEIRLSRMEDKIDRLTERS